MSDCIFCRVVAGESPASVFYENDVVLGFMDMGAVTQGHVLVIPKRHCEYLADMDEEEGRHLFTVARRAAAALRKSGVRCEGVNMFLADGEAAFQEVFHVHLHVFPRYEGDSFKISADWGNKPPRSELDEVASQIAAAYQSLWGNRPVQASNPSVERSPETD